MDLWIGTSGYSYSNWVGPFYRPGTSARDMLTSYAHHFPLTELNYTFYRMPAAKDLTTLAAKTPRGFQFIVKLHRSISHEGDLEAAGAFRQAAVALQEKGKLLALLCQYPQRLHSSSENRDRLAALVERLHDLPLAVEFRHRSWDTPATIDWLRQRGLHIVSVDVPDISALFPTRLVQSSRLIYVRWHSRRKESWYSSHGERYDYLYSDEELRDWVAALTSRAGSADRALLLFNNCQRGQAAINARRFRELVESAKVPLRVVPPFDEDNQQPTLF